MALPLNTSQTYWHGVNSAAYLDLDIVLLSVLRSRFVTKGDPANSIGALLYETLCLQN